MDVRLDTDLEALTNGPLTRAAGLKSRTSESSARHSMTVLAGCWNQDDFVI
jgi:hypothetical protein